MKPKSTAGLAYLEKLKDPRWQRKRLEVLEKSDFACDSCGDSESTLHVHHKQYFKGREPWEYDTAQLSTLCESCHEASHEQIDPLLLAASFSPIDGPFGRSSLASLINGYCGIESEGDTSRERFVGRLAILLASWPHSELPLDELVRCVYQAESSPQDFISHMLSFNPAKGGSNA